MAMWLVGVFAILLSSMTVYADNYSEDDFLKFVKSPAVVEAMKGLGSAFPGFKKENGAKDADGFRKAVLKYYEGEFGKNMKRSLGKNQDI